MSNGKRYVEVAGLGRAVTRAMKKIDTPPDDVLADVTRWVERQPKSPDLVGVAEAATILNLPKPRISRLREQGRMPEPVAELISGPVWNRQEVQALSDLLAKEREAREAKRAAKAAI
jgi:hypothetical protein